MIRLLVFFLSASRCTTFAFSSSSISLRHPCRAKRRGTTTSRSQLHQQEQLKHELHWLDDFEPNNDPDDDVSTVTLGQSIADGEVVLCLPQVATQEECEQLVAAVQEAVMRRETPAARGRSRFSVSDPTAFANSVVMKCEEILLRVLDYLDEKEPSIYDTLFWPRSETWCEWQPWNAAGEEPSVPPLPQLAEQCTNLRELYMAGELEWSEGEPALNYYQGGGYFGAHKDHLALTVLIPLTSPDTDFDGGGTGYWAGNRDTSENPEGREPDVVLKPPAGSALVFGGDVTHAGMPVETGARAVFVCSLSTRTPASSPDRLHGMKAPPVTSADFKGTL